MPLRLGYNTNGFAGHPLPDVIDLLAEIGYRSVAITLDRDALNPYGEGIAAETRFIRQRLDRLGLSCVVETGARFLLDPVHKHEPTLLSATVAERERRLDFLERAVDVAAELGAAVVSFWSGRKPASVSETQASEYLLEGCSTLAVHAATRGVNLAFEPEPGMFIETMAQFDRLRSRLDSPGFLLTLDVGHVHCLADGMPAERIRQYAGILANVHIEDMRRGVHEHLMFGDGEMEFDPIIAALEGCRYTGGVHVELSRHSHDAENAARAAYRFLARLIREG